VTEVTRVAAAISRLAYPTMLLLVEAGRVYRPHLVTRT
jgi:hypothetical protein